MHCLTSKLRQSDAHNKVPPLNPNDRQVVPFNFSLSQTSGVSITESPHTGREPQSFELQTGKAGQSTLHEFEFSPISDSHTPLALHTQQSNKQLFTFSPVSHTEFPQRYSGFDTGRTGSGKFPKKLASLFESPTGKAGGL